MAIHSDVFPVPAKTCFKAVMQVGKNMEKELAQTRLRGGSYPSYGPMGTARLESVDPVLMTATLVSHEGRGASYMHVRVSRVSDRDCQLEVNAGSTTKRATKDFGKTFIGRGLMGQDTPSVMGLPQRFIDKVRGELRSKAGKSKETKKAKEALSPKAKLKKLKTLLEEGLIDEDEYRKKRKAVVDSL